MVLNSARRRTFWKEEPDLTWFSFIALRWRISICTYVWYWLLIFEKFKLDRFVKVHFVVQKAALRLVYSIGNGNTTDSRLLRFHRSLSFLSQRQRAASIITGSKMASRKNSNTQPSVSYIQFLIWLFSEDRLKESAYLTDWGQKPIRGLLESHRGHLGICEGSWYCGCDKASAEYCSAEAIAGELLGASKERVEGEGALDKGKAVFCVFGPYFELNASWNVAVHLRKHVLTAWTFWWPFFYPEVSTVQFELSALCCLRYQLKDLIIWSDCVFAGLIIVHFASLRQNYFEEIRGRL